MSGIDNIRVLMIVCLAAMLVGMAVRRRVDERLVLTDTFSGGTIYSVGLLLYILWTKDEVEAARLLRDQREIIAMFAVGGFAIFVIQYIRNIMGGRDD